HRCNRSKPPTQDRRRLSRYMRCWLVERSSPGFNGSAGSSFAGSTTPRTSWALFNSPASLSSSGDFEIGSSVLRFRSSQTRLQHNDANFGIGTLAPGEDRAMWRFWRAVTCAFALATLATQPPAQTCPAKPVRIIVPYAPGGLTDVVARLYSEQLRQRFGRTVFVENKPGASGIIAIEEMARARPDGHTLM